LIRGRPVRDALQLVRHTNEQAFISKSQALSVLCWRWSAPAEQNSKRQGRTKDNDTDLATPDVHFRAILDRLHKSPSAK
jgi:hypothetical protein